MKIREKKRKNKVFTLRLYEEEFEMVKKIRSNSSVDLPEMLRKYIKEIYHKLYNKDPDDIIYG